MRRTVLRSWLIPLITALLALPCAAEQPAVQLSRISSQADLDAVIAATNDGTLKQALTEHGPAILTAAARHPHVAAVIRTIELAPGTYEKCNTTPEALRRAVGGDIAIFDTLTAVNTAILNGHAHQIRDKTTDPYDDAFIEHLGHIPTLEFVAVVMTRLEDAWLDPLLKLDRLKSLRIEKRGGSALGDTALAKLRQLEHFPDLRSLAVHYSTATDAGLAHLAGLRHLESFSLRANLPGHAFAMFEGWDNLKSIAFHGNGIDDEGLGHICDRFPALESLNLIHARQLTDGSAVHLRKLPKLKSILINGPKITAAWLEGTAGLPLEALNIAQGAVNPVPAAIATVRSIPTLRRLSIEGTAFTDADLAGLASATQLTDLGISGLDLPDDRLPQLQAFSFLETLTLRFTKGYREETQAKIRALLPAVDVKFVQ